MPKRERKRYVTGLDLSGQTPLIELREFGKRNSLWIIWISYNLDRTAGTYLVLHRNGQIVRETLLHDGSTKVIEVKGKEL